MIKLLHSVSAFQVVDGGVPRAVAGLIDPISHFPEFEIQLQHGEDGKQQPYPVDPLIQRRPIPFIARKPWQRILPTGFKQATLLANSSSRFDLVHHHGVWLRTAHDVSVACREAGLPLVISPHGMFEKWSLAHNRLKKRLAWNLYQKSDCHGARAFHATSKMEAQAVRDLGMKQPIALIPNGVSEISAQPLDPEAVNKTKQRRIALYFSRLSQKKNVPTLIESWAKLRPKDWELIIVGNDSEGVTPELIAMVEKLGLSDSISIPGPMFGADKDTIFRRADLFVLPTFSENFGIVVTEALQYGLPVITTTGTPWEELSVRGCGWWVEPTVDAFGGALGEALNMTPEALSAMGEKGIPWVHESFLWEPLARQLAQFYEWLLGRGDKPQCVIDE
ncbi:glycosyltransferase [Cerasicoccus arenae]|uniref:Glycosyl transferase family 1 n=1 Tax=Cerasicoccus arenae TaxID=424488 RepID=A0A8J3DIY0_9BACT|nr:glycosyltransferase [Cerasicoccus arenae]MBK1858645.1 glycosyltransferase [Cerasicoccus arenae]GHC04817.1 glycosyl transferase family 1 [Cerasicoccus arenae]